MKRISAIFFLLASLIAAVGQTNLVSTNAVRSLTLDECITEALKHNFDVQVERFAPEISLDNLHAAYGGWDPTLNASGQHQFGVSGGGLNQDNLPIPPNTSDQNIFSSGVSGVLPEGLQYNFSGNLSEAYGTTAGTPFDDSVGDISMNLTQPVLKNFWIDNTRTTIYVNKNRLKYSEQGLRLQLMTTVSAVENAYFEVGYARAYVTVQEEALGLASQQLSDDQQRVRIQVLAEHGGTIEQDEAQVAQNRASLIGAQYTLASDENALKNLITDRYTDWHDVDIVPADKMEAVRQMYDVQDSWSKGMTMRPDLQQAKLNAEQQGIQLKYLKNQLFPELDLVGSYGYNGAGREFSDALGEINRGNEPFYTYGAQMTMPLSNIAARDTYKSGKVTEAQLLLQLKQLEQNVMVEIDNDVKQAESAWESVEANRDQRIYAEVALSAEQQKYAVGKSTTFTVLQLQNNVTSARSAEIRSLANYNEALTTLAQQEGSILKSRNIDIEVK